MRAEPRLDPAYAVELGERERDALMTDSDWAWMLERFFAESMSETGHLTDEAASRSTPT